MINLSFRRNSKKEVRGFINSDSKATWKIQEFMDILEKTLDHFFENPSPFLD